MPLRNDFNDDTPSSPAHAQHHNDLATVVNGLVNLPFVAVPLGATTAYSENTYYLPAGPNVINGTGAFTADGTKLWQIEAALYVQLTGQTDFAVEASRDDFVAERVQSIPYNFELIGTGSRPSWLRLFTKARVTTGGAFRQVVGPMMVGLFPAGNWKFRAIKYADEGTLVEASSWVFARQLP